MAILRRHGLLLAPRAVRRHPDRPLQAPARRARTGATVQSHDRMRRRPPVIGVPREHVRERLARRSSRTDHFNAFSGPASGMAGDRGDDLAGVQRTKRSGVNGTPVSSSSEPCSRTREENQARDPRARERAAVVASAGIPREGWPPEGARRWAFDSGSMRSATARPRAAGARPTTSVETDAADHASTLMTTEFGDRRLCRLRPGERLADNARDRKLREEVATPWPRSR